MITESFNTVMPNITGHPDYDPQKLIELSQDEYIELNNRIAEKEAEIRSRFEGADLSEPQAKQTFLHTVYDKLNKESEPILKDYGITPGCKIYLLKAGEQKIGSDDRWGKLADREMDIGAMKLLDYFNGSVERFKEIMGDHKPEFHFDYDEEAKTYTVHTNISDLRVNHLTKPQAIESYFDQLIEEIKRNVKYRMLPEEERYEITTGYHEYKPLEENNNV